MTSDDSPTRPPRLIIDLGLPRNVDPAVERLPGVELLDLERLGRHAALPELGAGAHSLVGSAAAAFAAETRGGTRDRRLPPTRRTRCSRLSSTACAPEGATSAPKPRCATSPASCSHGPSVRARELAAEGRLAEYEDALELLFGISVDRRRDEGWLDRRA